MPLTYWIFTNFDFHLFDNILAKGGCSQTCMLIYKCIDEDKFRLNLDPPSWDIV